TAASSVVVLPVPGPPSTSSGPPVCATTARWTSSSSGGSATARRTSRYATFLPLIPAMTPCSSDNPRVPPREAPGQDTTGRLSLPQPQGPFMFQQGPLLLQQGSPPTPTGLPSYRR